MLVVNVLVLQKDLSTAQELDLMIQCFHLAVDLGQVSTGVVQFVFSMVDMRLMFADHSFELSTSLHLTSNIDPQ
eukprot:10316750-Heterocapsa_arctica.AAC.1